MIDNYASKILITHSKKEQYNIYVENASWYISHSVNIGSFLFIIFFTFIKEIWFVVFEAGVCLSRGWRITVELQKNRLWLSFVYNTNSNFDFLYQGV